ncbi:MAG TPA: helix-turn-helix domain-containing protein [Opitutaceae bacterium]
MQTIGERLEEARKKKGISIREAAEATKIRGDYLQKFETNHFDIGLTEIYTRGFLRTYANFLKLPSDRILSDYASLGRGDVRPRQPNREVYARMEMSKSSSGDAADRSATPEDSPAPEPSHANRGPNRRAPAGLPAGPDPALVFKYVKIGGAAVIVIVALILTWKLISGSKRPSTAEATPTRTELKAPRTPILHLIALRPVQVTVTVAISEREDGEVLWRGQLAAGETKLIPYSTDIFLDANPREALDIENNGERVNWGARLAPYGPITKARISPPRQ